MGKGLEVKLAEIYADFREGRKTKGESMRAAFDAIAEARARTPADLEAILDDTIAEAFRRGYEPYPPVRQVRVEEKYWNDLLKKYCPIRYWRPEEVPLADRTVTIAGRYQITPFHLEGFRKFFEGRIAYWQARLKADEGPQWDRAAAEIREKIRRRGLTHKAAAELAGVSEKTIQRLIAGKPIRRESLKAIEKALHS